MILVCSRPQCGGGRNGSGEDGGDGGDSGGGGEINGHFLKPSATAPAAVAAEMAAR